MSPNGSSTAKASPSWTVRSRRSGSDLAETMWKGEAPSPSVACATIRVSLAACSGRGEAPAADVAGPQPLVEDHVAAPHPLGRDPLLDPPTHGRAVEPVERPHRLHGLLDAV